MEYNRYDLVNLVINGQDMVGRPIEFDSDAVGDTMLNAFGSYVKPTKASTCCPDCGNGIVAPLDDIGDPPFKIISLNCPECNPDQESVSEPFVNPFSESELDPLIVNKDTDDDDSTTVSERISGEDGNQDIDDQGQIDDIDNDEYFEDINSLLDDMDDLGDD